MKNGLVANTFDYGWSLKRDRMRAQFGLEP
jgi:hypothetical protein